LGVVIADWASISVQAIWAKGYTELLELMEIDSASREMHTHIDCYGYGDDLEEVPLLPSLLCLPDCEHVITLCRPLLRRFEKPSA
jgi:hypothetical protein